MMKAIVCLFLLSQFGISVSQDSVRCPLELGWINSGLVCYRFVDFPELNYRDAVYACKDQGATLVSISSELKHNFIRSWLMKTDVKRNWWTSGRTDEGDIYWEGNGSRGLFTKGWVVPESEYQKGYQNMFYKYDETTFGWAVGNQWISMSYICEISIQEVYRITQEKRGFDYGLNVQNPSDAPRGPFFLVEPVSVTILSRTDLVYFDCVASGNPGVTYQWLKQNVDRQMVPLDFSNNKRYSTVTGRLNILNPSSANRDQGTFQCKVMNDYGTILSSPVELNFGSMSNFSAVASGNVDATEQMGAQLECPTISGSPGLVYQWYKNSATSFIRPNIQTHSFISASGKLLFSEVAESDGGTYYCVASLTGYGLNRNYIGSSQTKRKLSKGFNLIVKKSGGNTYSVDIQKEFIYVYPNTPMKGNTVRLECFAYGSLPLTYTWGKVNRPLPEGRHKFDSANRILIIYNIDLSDEDTYYCNVSSSKTNTKESTSLSLEILAKPFFVYPLQHQHIDYGTRLTWHCEAIGKPFPVYTWYKDGMKLTSSPGLTVKGNTIIISSLEPKHNGMYQCGAKNELGESFSTAQLRVLEIKPSFDKSPMTKFVTGAIGGDVTLRCNPIGAPRPVFTWFKDNQPITFDDHYQLLLTGDLRIAQIDKARDEGIYKCHVKNDLGEAEDATAFRVNERAQFYEMPRDDKVEVNLTVTLMCQASHAQNMDMIYIWSFNDHVINFEREPEYRLGRGKEEGYLYVTSAQFRNEGRYTCAIVSASDRQSGSCYLSVLGPPGEPGGLRVHELNPVMEIGSSDGVDMATTRWVTWHDGDKHGKEPITHYFIEFRTEFDKNWRVHNDGSNIPISQTVVDGKDGLHYARITNLKAGAGIQFRIRARNAYGIGTPSLPTSLTTMNSAPPTKTVSNLRGGGGSVGDLTFWWDPLPREDHNGPNLHYRIQWREHTKKGETFQSAKISHTKACRTKINIEMGSMFVCQFVKLVGSKLYYTHYDAEIQAFNSVGSGPMSAISDIMSAETLPQGSPASVYALEYNATALMIFWTPVENIRERAGGTLKGYKINYWRRHEKESQALQNIIELKESQTNLNQGMIIGLTPITWYRFNVQAYNSAGNGLKSSTFEQETLNDVPNRFPTEVYVYSIEGKGVQVKFRGISTRAGEEPLQGYKIQVWESNENIRSAREYDLGKKNSGVIRYLNSSIVYQLRVFAYSRAGQGKRSSPTVFFTVGDGQILSNPETTEIMSVASVNNASVITTLFFIILVRCIMTTPYRDT